MRKRPVFKSKIAAEPLGFYLCESCLKVNEEYLRKSADDNAKDVGELNLIIRTTDKLVDAITDQGRQTEEFQQLARKKCRIVSS